ncbi:MAG: glycosyltransferase family 4 protein [Gemmatimonadaceae bacterium]
MTWSGDEMTNAVARRPRRILFVEGNDDETVGGSHRSMFDLVRLIDRELFTPVVCFYRDNEFVDQYRKIGVEAHVVEDRRRRELQAREQGARWRIWSSAIAGIFWRRAMLRRLRIDLLHINNSVLVAADDWLPAARLRRIPTVCMARGDAVIESRRVRFLARFFDRIVAVSLHMSEAVLSFGVAVERVAMVHNGIDFERLRGGVERSKFDVREELRVRDGQVLALMVGNIREWKGQHVVLEALAALPPEIRAQVHIAFVGDTGIADRAYHELLRELVRSGHLEDQVDFLGPRTDVSTLLSASDIALHCSVLPEPFGRVVPEAMGLGVPIVASSIGGPREVVTETSGRLFDPGKPEQLAAILRDLIEHPEHRASISAAGRLRAQDFGVQRMVAGVTRVYLDVLRERGDDGA